MIAAQESNAGFPRPKTERLVEEIFRAAQPSKVLCLAHSLPPVFTRTSSRVVLVGSTPPSESWSARSLDFRKADTNAELMAALSEYVSLGERFDLIFVDHDHRIKALIEQVDAVARLSHDSTVVLFDDAVPPAFEMASDEPRSGWWVGSVWMIPQLKLFGPQECTLCVDSSPTGLFAAIGKPAVDIAAATDMARTLETMVGSVDDIRAGLDLADPHRVTGFMSVIGRVALSHHYVTVRPAAEAEYSRFESTELAPTSEFFRPVPAVFADLSGGTVKHYFATQEAVRLERQALMEFRDATLVGTNAIFIDGVLYGRYTRAGVSDIARISKDLGYGNEGTGLIQSDGAYFLPKTKFTAPTRLRGRYVLATPDERDNWGMWLLVTLPSVLFFLKHRADYDGLICYTQKSWQRGFLRFLGVDEADLIPHVLDASYEVDRLVALCRGSRNLCVTDFDRRCFSDVVAKVLAQGPLSEGEPIDYRRLFISRRSSSISGYRALIDEAELIRRLESLGFISIEPEKLAFAEQIRIFQQAEIIVGLGGAGMFNAVFAKPGTSIVTIESSSNWVHSHVNLFATCHLDYGVMFGREDISDERLFHRRWHIDVEAVVDALSPLLSQSVGLN